MLYFVAQSDGNVVTIDEGAVLRLQARKSRVVPFIFTSPGDATASAVERLAMKLEHSRWQMRAQANKLQLGLDAITKMEQRLSQLKRA